MFNYKDIRSVHLEISTRCNAACPDCSRNLRGADVEEVDYVLHTMTLEEAKIIFPPNFLLQLNSIHINGNYGDFIVCRDGLEIIQYFSKTNKNLSINISTNASGQPKIWSELGSIKNLSVQFRLDGLKDTHHLYRRYTDFDLIMSNAKDYIDAGGYAVWSMIKFNHNQHQIAEATELSKLMGFKRFELIDAGRDNSVVFDRKGNYQYTIGTPHPEIRELKFYSDARKGPHGHDNRYKNTVSKTINCEAKAGRSIYVQANGQIYPCCYIGKSPDQNLAEPGSDQTRLLQHNNSALEFGMEEAIKWFNDLEKSWSIETVAQGRHYVCNEICGSL